MRTKVSPLTEEEFEALKVGGLEVNYLVVCPRKLWLYSRQIRMEPLSDKVALAAFLHETAFPRMQRRELLIEDLIRVDIVEGTGKVLEIKFSRKMEEAARLQLLYYLYFLKRRGVEGLAGEIRFPKERRRIEVRLTEDGERAVEEALRRVAEVKSLPEPPPAEWSPICRACAYAELCWG